MLLRMGFWNPKGFLTEDGVGPEGIHNLHGKQVNAPAQALTQV